MGFKLNKFFLLFLLALIPQSGCELMEIIVVDCNTCYTNYSEVSDIKVKVTINEENQQVTITAYYGPYENNNIAFVESSTREEKILFLETDKHYTLKAEYTKNGRTYYVINGAKLTVRRDTESCSDPCYYVTGKNVDLRLKF